LSHSQGGLRTEGTIPPYPPSGCSTCLNGQLLCRTAARLTGLAIDYQNIKPNWLVINPFTVNLFLELFLNYDQLTYKNLLHRSYVLKSLATIYHRIARELMNTMTSFPLLSNQVCATYGGLFEF